MSSDRGKSKVRYGCRACGKALIALTVEARAAEVWLPLVDVVAALEL
jgi:hypothetical protein